MTSPPPLDLLGDQVGDLVVTPCSQHPLHRRAAAAGLVLLDDPLDRLVGGAADRGVPDYCRRLDRRRQSDPSGSLVGPCGPLTTRRETKSGGFYLAMTGDPDVASSGGFFMVTGSCGGKACGELPGQQW